MNRIILIGNGFDKAHGMATGYNDFIDSYWKKLTAPKATITIPYEDEFVKITDYKETIIPCIAIPSDALRRGLSFSKIRELTQDNPYDRGNYVNLHFKSLFFKKICELLCFDWVDVENEYYFSLVDTLKKTSKKEDKYEPVKRLNGEFADVRNMLEAYLRKVAQPKSKNQDICRKIRSSIYREDIALSKRALIPNTKLGIAKTLFLNFNYTKTVNNYIWYLKNSEVINIHGELSNPSNPIIFGFGDELNSSYKLIEEKNNNLYLVNIKSMSYLKTNNYRRLLEFVESDYFQIFIMGHSCGSSDRTLLNTLFEHKNCISIKPFYHQREDGSDNYDDIVCNISRNFKDKQLMRDLVVNQKFCRPLVGSKK